MKDTTKTSVQECLDRIAQELVQVQDAEKNVISAHMLGIMAGVELGRAIEQGKKSA